jgi:hypothetical protein
MQVYQDSSWIVPTFEDLINAVIAFNESVTDLLSTAQQYQSALVQYQADFDAAVAAEGDGSSSRKGRRGLRPPAIDAKLESDMEYVLNSQVGKNVQDSIGESGPTLMTRKSLLG